MFRNIFGNRQLFETSLVVQVIMSKYRLRSPSSILSIIIILVSAFALIFGCLLFCQ